MKNFLLLLLLGLGMAFCSRVTTRPDKSATTIGTMGSIKATDEPVRKVTDTLTMADSLNNVNDSIR